MNFIIYGPNWSRRSGGIRALHKLGWILKQKGHTVSLAGKEHPSTDWGRLLNPDEPLPFWNGDKNGIIVYPEIIPTNPLGISKVVRWVLGPVGEGWAKINDDGALFFSWINYWGYGLDELYVPIVDENYFNLNGVGNRDLILTYKTSRVPGDIEITDSSPSNWNELVALLKRAIVLRSGDNITCLTIDARLCGCPVLLTNYDGSFDFNDGFFAGFAVSEAEIDSARADLSRFYSAYVEYKDKADSLVDKFIDKCRERWGE